MYKPLTILLVAAASALAQYKIEPAGTPPGELAPAIAALMQKEGTRVVAANGTAVCELWFRTSLPSGPKSTEEGQTFTALPHGSIIGAIRFPPKSSDRRGQSIAAGVYTLRYGLHPVNGDHLGVSPQRDFAVLVPAADDKDAASTPNFDELMPMSRKASGTPHPAVLSISSSSSGKFPDVAKEGDHDWVLHVKIGDSPVAVTVVGKAEG
ncbi:MAG: hypothetical protein EXQ52_05925 [Bryobacterales bacterium]|nr:hypothetical protein [Bryobacterales bacterium]